MVTVIATNLRLCKTTRKNYNYNGKKEQKQNQFKNKQE